MGGKCCTQQEQKQNEINIGNSSVISKESITKSNNAESNMKAFAYDREITAGVNRPEKLQINNMKISQGIQTVSVIFQDQDCSNTMGKRPLRNRQAIHSWFFYKQQKQRIFVRQNQPYLLQLIKVFRDLLQSMIWQQYNQLTQQINISYQSTTQYFGRIAYQQSLFLRQSQNTINRKCKVYILTIQLKQKATKLNISLNQSIFYLKQKQPFDKITEDMNFELLIEQMMIVLKDYYQILQKKKKEQFKSYHKKELTITGEWLILFAIHDYLARNFQNHFHNDAKKFGNHTFSVISPSAFRHSWSLSNNNNNNNNQTSYNMVQISNNYSHPNIQNQSNNLQSISKQQTSIMEGCSSKQPQINNSARYQVLRHFNSEGDLQFKVTEEQQGILTVLFMRIFYTIYSKKNDMMCSDSQRLFEVIELVALNFIRLDQREVNSLSPEKQLGILIEVGKYLQLYGNHQCTLNYYNTLEMDFHRAFSKQFIKLYELQALNLNKLGKHRESIVKYNLALALQDSEDEKHQKAIHAAHSNKFPSSAAIPAISKFNIEDPQIGNDYDKLGSELILPVSLIDQGIVSYQVAQIYSQLKEFDTAIEYFQKSLDYNLKNKDRGSNISHKSLGSQVNLHRQDEVHVHSAAATPQLGKLTSQNSLEQFDLIGTRNNLEFHNSGGKNQDLRNCSILQNIAQMYFQKKDLESAVEYLTRAYEIYQSDFKLTEQTKYIKLLTQMCSIYSARGQYSESIQYAEEALQLIGQKYGTSNYKELKSILENLQILYLNEQKVVQSLEINRRLIKLVEENNLDDLVLAQYLESNGILNYKLNNYEESLRSSYLAMRMYRDKYGDKSIEVARIQQNIAQTLSQQKSHKYAYAMAKNCLEIFSQNTQRIEQEELSYVLYNIAQFALNIDLKEEAFQYIKQSKELLETKQGKPLNENQEIIILYKKISELINTPNITTNNNY